MTEHEYQELKVLEEMLAHPGWAVLTRHTQQQIEAFQSGAPFNITNEADLNVHKGIILTLRNLLAMPDHVAAALASHAEDSGE